MKKKERNREDEHESTFLCDYVMMLLSQKVGKWDFTSFVHTWKTAFFFKFTHFIHSFIRSFDECKKKEIHGGTNCQISSYWIFFVYKTWKGKTASSRDALTQGEDGGIKSGSWEPNFREEMKRIVIRPTHARSYYYVLFDSCQNGKAHGNITLAIVLQFLGHFRSHRSNS